MRHLGEAARVEIAREEMARLDDPGGREPRSRRRCAAAGYAEVEIDPEGYRRGRLNEALRVRAGGRAARQTGYMIRLGGA